MQCWNCLTEIPDGTRVCQYCEAKMEEAPTEEDKKFVQAFLESIDEETHAALIEAARESSTAEEFVNRVMVGSCPSCDSADVDSCENDPEIDNLLVGRCYECGQLWCLECERPFDKGEISCPCVIEDDDDD